MSKRANSYKYRHGEPVWARVEGHPWWPGRVVLPAEIVCDEGEKKPSVRKGELLIEFFDEAKSFASLSITRHIRPFLKQRNAHNFRHVEGIHDPSLQKSIKRIQKYVSDNSWTPSERINRQTLPSTSLSHESPETPKRQRQTQLNPESSEKDHQDPASLARLQYTPYRPDADVPTPTILESASAQSPSRVGEIRVEPEIQTVWRTRAMERANPDAQRLKRRRREEGLGPEPSPQVTNIVKTRRKKAHTVLKQPSTQDKTYLTIPKVRKSLKATKKAVHNETTAGNVYIAENDNDGQEPGTGDVDGREGETQHPHGARAQGESTGQENGNTETIPTLGLVPSGEDVSNDEGDSPVQNGLGKRAGGAETLESSIAKHDAAYSSLRKEMTAHLRNRDDTIATLQSRLEKVEEGTKALQDLAKIGKDLNNTGKDIIRMLTPFLQSLSSDGGIKATEVRGMVFSSMK